ncbi:MAG TPA: tRNA (N6-isopentenyl adenosine(37)-C2)-methylthiotransferase MiaB [Fibrobacteraceae bacterium]|nr:tRNA (N6-isopentenyl adenosine(37)-C2)-methylthiotransferase MiaB [Fibrobacteraceae bacterium]
MIPRYYLATYGCQMNEYDSHLVATMLEERGFEEAHQAADADLVVVNTCSIREKAEENIQMRIQALRPLKEARPGMRIAVIGCMAENLGEKIRETLHHVDLVVGPDHYRELVELVSKPSAPQNATLVGFLPQEQYEGWFAKSITPFSTHIAIQKGCNKRCSYCIVPFTRGQEKYRPVDQILAEARHAVDQGVKEITLLGQTVNAYRSESESFVTLLDKVSQINGLERLRFLSPHPRHYTQELIDQLAHNPKICRHVHLPLQSGSDVMLKSMRRQYDLEDFLSIVERLRAIDPLYGISTDIIVGFVGETVDDFQQTLKALQICQFDSAFLFRYSPRKGTESSAWKETLTEMEKGERLQEAIDLQNGITLARNRLMLGRTETILVEGPSRRDPLEFIGKTSSFKKVVLVSPKTLQPGDLVEALLNDLRGWTLRGEPLHSRSLS